MRLAEAFVVRESDDPDGEFIRRLRSIASRAGGVLPLSHESPSDGWRGIQRDGYIGTGEGSVFCTVGHLVRPSFVTGPGVIIQIDLPGRLVRPGVIVPDMRFDGAADLLAQHPDVVGAEVGVGVDRIPRSWWRAVLDNRTGGRLP